MTKIIAICGGGDWADASVEHVMLPEGLDIQAEHKAWREWYNNSYFPSLTGSRIAYVSFTEWLKSKGAREPSDDQLEVVWDD